MLPVIRPHLVERLVTVPFSPLAGFEETKCLESYNCKELNAAPLAHKQASGLFPSQPPGENPALADTLRRTQRSRAQTSNHRNHEKEREYILKQ